MTLRERFLTKVERGADCWEWRGYRHPSGYGYMRKDGKPTTAHRVSYELHIGPIPDGLQIDHLCRNRGCVNPSHLEPVTARENCRRGEIATRTHCAAGHPYDDSTHVTASGHRRCRICKRKWDAVTRAKRRGLYAREAVA